MSKANPISNHHLYRLLEISTMLSSTLDLGQLLEMVIQVAAELTDMEHASLLLLGKASHQLEFVATSNEPALVGMAVPIERSIAGWVLTHAEPLILDKVHQDKRHYQEVAKVTDVITESMIAVPLIYKGVVMGVLEAINKREGRVCSPQDVILLSALASQAAVAITNAHLFQQTDIIAEIMHELKTPLLALQAATELMERPDLPPQKQKIIVQMLKQEGERMKRMVQGYLELARFDSGRIKLKQEVVNLEALVAEVVEMQRPQAAQKEIGIVIATEENLPIFTGDEDKLRQLLLNLISNAIKYNRVSGQIEVRLTAVGDELTLAVEDTGPGIAPANLARLFERFYRVPGSEGYTEGTGLGLSIAQKIVEAHHGRIQVTSELGKGTTFYCIFTLNKE